MRLAILFPLLAACDAIPSGQLLVERDIAELAGWGLALTFDRSQATAGDSVPYTVVLTDPDGVEVQPSSWSLASATEPELFWSTTEVRPRVSGEHFVTLTVDVNGASLTSGAPLTVSPSGAFDLDLVLSDHGLRAGDEITFTVSAVDRFGNTIDASGTDVGVIGDVTVGAGTITSTTPGVYVAEATLGDLDDVETFVVSPGPARSIDLTLSRTQLEVRETASATVVIRDTWGNPTPDPWTLTTSRPAATFVSFRNVTFFEEGWYTVTATVDGTSLSDHVGPFLIDSTGPKLTITSPGRGSWLTTTSASVYGTVTDDWSTEVGLTINGVSTPVNANGSFSRTVPFSFGTNVIETVATDREGNVTVDTRAVLQGQFKAYNTWVPNGIVVRMNEGTGGLGTLEEIGEDLVRGTDIASLIPSPVYQNSSSSSVPCFPDFWNSCTVTWYSVRLFVTNPSVGDNDMLIDPRSDGRVTLAETVYNPRLNWNGNGHVVGISYSGSGSITASSITATLLTTPRVSSNRIFVDINSVSASASNFNFNFNGFGWLETALGWFGVNIDNIVWGYVRDGLIDAVRAEAPGALEDALQDLELGYDFDLEDRTYGLDARPQSISVDNNGLSIAMETRVTVDQWVHPGWAGWGSLQRPYTPPTWTLTPRTNLAMSGDLLNQVLYAVWGGGALDIQENLADMGFDVAQLDLLLPGVESLYITVRPLLPPVVVPGSGTIEYQLQLGDLEITLYDGPPSQGRALIRAYTTAFAPLDVGSVSDLRLRATVGTAALYYDVVVPESNTIAAADTEALLAAIVPLLLPRLTSAIGEIDLPSIQGFGISGITVRTGGGFNGYTILGGNLYVE